MSTQSVRLDRGINDESFTTMRLADHFALVLQFRLSIPFLEKVFKVVNDFHWWLVTAGKII